MRSWAEMLEVIARAAVPFSDRHSAPYIAIETKWWPQGRIKIETAVMSGDQRFTVVGYGETVEAAVVDWVNAADRNAPGWSAT